MIMKKQMYEPDPISLPAEFPQSFRDLFQNEEYKRRQTFIGYGNPSAKILILGKEITWKLGSGEHLHYCQMNFEQWRKNLEAKDYIVVESEVLYPSDGVTTKAWENFNPIYPHYLKYNKKASGKKDENGNIILATSNYGVSVTWLNYQKLIQKIIGYNNGNKSPIDFFRYAFISELNELTRPNNNDNTKDDDKNIEKSIGGRFPLLNEPFFKSFPIIIFAGRPYPTKLFEPLYGFKPSDFTKKHRYDVYTKGDQIFIWTEQFSNHISTQMIEDIANEVKIKQRNIY